MRWMTNRPFHHSRLRRAATGYAERGWPVTPGAVLCGTRFQCGRAGCLVATCHPATERWEDAASHDPATVASRWRHAPWAVLLPTGRAFDAIEVPAALGMLAAGQPQPGPARGPVVVRPGGRWLFLVRPGHPLRPELDGRLDVLRHGRGSWVPAPPTRLPEGPVRWEVSPEQAGWRLPGSYAVQQALVEMLTETRTPQVRAALIAAPAT